jgi:hypothetical protein
MFWETISAIIFLFVLAVLWIPLSLLWAIGVFIFKLAIVIFGAFQVDEVLADLFFGVIGAGLSGLFAFADIPVELWDWAKFDHPWWALIISLFVGGALQGQNNAQ